MIAAAKPGPSSSKSSTLETNTITLDSYALFCSSVSGLSPSIGFDPVPKPEPSSIPPDFPRSKLIPKTRFVVDAFRLAGDFSVSYFLSHFHSDHYAGLSACWSKGLVFCSPITARLLTQVLKVPSPFVVPLPLSQPVRIDGSEVTLVDANHCPGAVQFLFKVPAGAATLDGDGPPPFGIEFERYVHTGDFRFCASMTSSSALAQFVGADAVFLDTTYCNPKFVFPSQQESIDYIASSIERIGAENKASPKSVLFLVATYVIGKERILVEVASRCGLKVHVDARKMAVLSVLGLGGDGGFFTVDDADESDVYVVGWNILGETWPYFRPNFVKMKEIMVERGYSRVVGFVPTGWTHEVKRNKFAVRTKDVCEIHLVPYSEHSNYDELREYVGFLRPKCVIPTVGIDIKKLDSKEGEKMQRHFAGLVDEMAIKHKFLMGFQQVLEGGDEKFSKHADSVLNGGHDDQGKEMNLNETKIVDGSDMGSNLDALSTVVDDDRIEELIKELRDILPVWLPHDKMLSLISGSGGNIVDAVSNFYERETEFHEQATTSTEAASVCASRTTSSGVDSVLHPNPAPSDDSPHQGAAFVFSQNCRAGNLKSPIKSNFSPDKKRKHLHNKPNKKAKKKSGSAFIGSKQPTITSFFNKISITNVSQGGHADAPVECYSDGISLPCGAVTSYKEEVDQFLHIIDGNESSRSYAAAILDKTKGDINKDEYDVNNVSPIVLEERRKMAEPSVHGISAEKLVSAFVSLPPEKYSPIEHACWRKGQPAPYMHLAQTFDLLESEKGKIKATSMLCNMFRSLLALSPEDVLPAVYLCTNKIAADHENMELNIGRGLVSAALEEACGTNRSKINDMYNNLGDLGDVAQACRQTQSLLVPPSPLLIKDVYSVLRKIGVQTGNGSAVRKKNLILHLMRSCKGKEIKFLVRTLVRNLRIGVMMRTVLPALAQAVVMISSFRSHCHKIDDSLKAKLQSLSAAVVEAYSIIPNLDLVVPSLMEKGIGFSSASLPMVLGIPIKPMLAKITNGISQALKVFQNKAFTCEYKYDGQRAQVHKFSDGSIHVYSRNGDETTSRFPDLVDIIKESCKPSAMSFILDAEAVAIDRKNSCKLMCFQELSSRPRGNKDSLISIDSIKVDICIFIFDIMFVNGEKLLGLPLRQRRTYFKDLFYGEKMGYLEYARETTVEADDACLNNEATLTKINYFLENAFSSSCEGIMVKSLDVDAGYFPSKRTDLWLKVKKDYLEGLNDSLDLVPIGAWYGNGRKAGWYSPFLMACYNPDTEEFQSVCRVMSGFSDSFYKEMKDFFSEDRILSRKPLYYQTAEAPDLWFSPELVWEIRGADFTVSPVHQAAVGLIHPSRGISIRFPKFSRSVSDRKPEECSTAADIVDLYQSQTRKMDVTGVDIS